MSMDPRIISRQECLQCNGDPAATIEDAYEDLEADCGMTPDGYCMNAGSEYCDFECPFRDDPE